MAVTWISFLFVHFTSDEFLMGTSSEFLMLQSQSNILPTEIMMKGKFFFIGRILQLLQVRVYEWDGFLSTSNLNGTCARLKESVSSVEFHDKLCIFFPFTLKFGIRPEGINQLFGASIPGFRGDLSFNDLQAVLKAVRLSLMFKKV